MKQEVTSFEMLRQVLDRFDMFLRESGITDDSIFDSHLILSELASNVLQHSNGKATVLGEIVDKRIEVEVRSSEFYIPPKPSETKLPDSEAESGRGLYIIDHVCERRYNTPDGGIRVVVKTEYRE